jgi:hypothetical protein
VRAVLLRLLADAWRAGSRGWVAPSSANGQPAEPNGARAARVGLRGQPLAEWTAACCEAARRLDEQELQR